MPENGSQRESSPCFPSPEAVRLLWEGTRKALDGGVDHEDLVSLCDIIVRLADHRLLYLQVKGDTSSAEVAEAEKQLRHYRKLASDLLTWAEKPTPEPDWASIATRLESVGASPILSDSQPKE